VLYARIAGRTNSAKPPPMTLTEGISISEQAKAFVSKFVTPILGHIASVKMHKLLCHIADVIKWHGSVQNCNTAINESELKADKPYYFRTNKDGRTFTRQLVVHAHGARGILARHVKEDEAASAAWQAELNRREQQQRSATADAAARNDRGSAAAATWAAPVTPARARASQGHSTAPIGALAESAALRGTALDSARQALEDERLRKKRMYNISNVTVGDWARRPDLASVGALLRMSSSREVRVATRKRIQARLECGTRFQQMLRAAEDYLGALWPASCDRLARRRHSAVDTNFVARLCVTNGVDKRLAVPNRPVLDTFLLLGKSLLFARHLCGRHCRHRLFELIHFSFVVVELFSVHGHYIAHRLLVDGHQNEVPLLH